MTARPRRHGQGRSRREWDAVGGSSSHAHTIGAAGGWMAVMGEALGAAGAGCPVTPWTWEDPRRTDRCAGVRRRLARPSDLRPTERSPIPRFSPGPRPRTPNRAASGRAGSYRSPTTRHLHGLDCW